MKNCNYVKNSTEPCSNCPKLISYLHSCSLLQETVKED